MRDESERLPPHELRRRPAENEGSARLFVDVWIRAASEAKALRVFQRLATRGGLLGSTLPPGFLDEDRGLWKYSVVNELPTTSPSAIVEVLQNVQSIARSFSVYNVHTAGSRWSIDGSADESQLAEPGVVCVVFSAQHDQ